jgi:tetratricopeptide (TPR) repeat protein
MGIMLPFMKTLVPAAMLLPGLLFGAGALDVARQAARDQLLHLAESTYREVLETAESPEEKHQALLELARTRLQLEDPAGAEELLNRLPRRISDQLRAKADLLLADLLQAGGDVEGARKHLPKPELLPDDWKDLHRAVEARCLFMEEGVDAAVALLQASLAERESVFLQKEKLNFLIRAGQLKEAEQGLKQLAGEPPLTEGGTRARITLAGILLEQNRSAEALVWLVPVLGEGTGSTRLEMQLYPLMIEALEKEEKPLEAAEMIRAFSVLIDDQDVLVELLAREARNRISGGQLEEMDQKLAEWIARYGDATALMTAQAALASAWMEEGRIEKANAAYQRTLSVVTDPQLRLQAEIGYANTLVELGEYDEAVTLAARVRNTLNGNEPAQASLLFLQADAELRRGNADAASDLFAEWITRYPGHDDLPAVYLRSSEAFAAAGRTSEAFEALNEVRERVPGSDLAEKAYLQRALLLGPRRVEQALGAFDAYLEAYPDGDYVADAMTEKGIAAYRLGLFDLAIREFLAVEEQYPDHPRAEQAFCLRGWAHYLKGEDAEAQRIGERFLETYPDSGFEADVRVWLAEMAYNRGDYVTAAEDFGILAGEGYATPVRTRSAYLAGRSHLAATEVSSALTWFQRSLELNPDSPFAPDVLFHLGDALTELDRFDEAIVKFDQVIREHPDSYLVSAAMGRIGDCQYTLGEKDPERYVESLNTYRQVKESASAPLELRLQATYKIGRVLSAMGREEEALSLFLEAATVFRANPELLPASASIWFVRSVTDAAQFYESREQYREAIKVYRMLSSTQLEGAAEAARRIEDLRRQHLILF